MPPSDSPPNPHALAAHQDVVVLDSDKNHVATRFPSFRPMKQDAR